MAPPRKIDLLPPEIRRELDDRLVRQGFAGYHDLSDWLEEHGFEISKSVLHKYGQQAKRDFNQTLSRLRIVDYMASQMPDDAENALDKVNAVALRDRLFELLNQMPEVIETEAEQTGSSEDTEQAAEKDAEKMDLTTQAKLLGLLSLTQARLSRAAVNRQKWTEELRIKAQAAAEAVEKIAAKSGLSADTAAEIRREILGIAS